MHVIESLTRQWPKEGRISGVHITTRPVEVFVICNVVFSNDILRWGCEDFVLVSISIGFKISLELQGAFTANTFLKYGNNDFQSQP
jgi:hypothetical protein